MSIKLDDTDFEAVIAGASQPILVMFMSSFCGPSHALFPVIDDLIEADANDFVYAEVDVEDCPLMTRKFEVKGTPTLIWFANGEPIGSRAGTMSEGFLRDFVTKMKAA